MFQLDPNPPDDHFEEDIPIVYNEATQEELGKDPDSPEDEFLGFLDVPTIFNPATEPDMWLTDGSD